MKEYERLEEHEKPFTKPAEREHLSDDDSDAQENVQKAAQVGASGDDAKTDFEPKLRKHLRSRRHHDSVTTQRPSPDSSNSSASGGGVRRDHNLGSKNEQDGDDDYHHQFAGKRGGEMETASSGREKGNEADQNEASLNKT